MTTPASRPEQGAALDEARPGPVLARLAEPTSATPTRLAVVADPHVTPTERGTWKVYHRTETRFRAAIETVNELRPDATVLLGDLTKDGAPEEYEVVDEVLDGLVSPAVAVPGNHDVPKRWDDYDAPPASVFAERYGRGRYPFRVGVGGVDLVYLDSATGEGGLHDSHEGLVSQAQLDWLDRTLTDTRPSIVALHHNLLHARTHTGQFPDADFYQLRNADALHTVLDRHDVPLVLSGHLHWPAAAKRGGVREVLAPATCSFPQAVLVADVGPEGTTVRLVPVAAGEALAEAFIHARAGSAHGQGIAEHAERGYFDDLPVFAERHGHGIDQPEVPQSVRWR